MKAFSRKQQGFTLIEIMVVVVILGILSALVVPKMMNRPEQARLVKAKQDIMAIQNALDLYKLDNGFYPSTEQGLQALVEKPSASPTPKHWHACLKSLPSDPWEHPYLYMYPGEHGEFDIFTYGADGEMGEKVKVSNWEAQTEDNAPS